MLSSIQRYGPDLEGITLALDPVTRTVNAGPSRAEADEDEMASAIERYLQSQPEPVEEKAIHEAVEGRKAVKVAALRKLVGQWRVTRSSTAFLVPWFPECGGNKKTRISESREPCVMKGRILVPGTRHFLILVPGSLAVAHLLRLRSPARSRPKARLLMRRSTCERRRPGRDAPRPRCLPRAPRRSAPHTAGERRAPGGSRGPSPKQGRRDRAAPLRPDLGIRDRDCSDSRSHRRLPRGPRPALAAQHPG
jgi:hypothetical protein